MNKIKLYKEILLECGELRNSLFIEFKFPGVPVPGMIFLKGDIEERIKEVYFDIDNNVFYCYAEPEKEIYNAQLNGRDHRNIAEIIKEYTDRGWNIEK